MSRPKKRRAYRSVARSSPALSKHLHVLGENLRELRARAELTQEHVATVAKIDAKHYQAIEAGRINVTMSTLVAIAHGLDVNLLALFVRHA